MKYNPLKLTLFLILSLAPAGLFAQGVPNTAYIDTSLLRVVKSAPKTIVVGNTFEWTYQVEVKGRNAGIIVGDTIPNGYEYISSTPQAQVNGDRIIWKFSNVNPGQSQTLSVSLRAEREGDMSSCFTAQAISQGCLTSFVGRPEIALTKSGPATALIGSNVDYAITVSNPGSLPLNNVVVKDQIPAGLSHSSGKNLISYTVGNLAPGEKRTIPLTLRAVTAGSACNTATASSSNGGNATAEACTVILKPGLTITKRGDAKQKVGKKADYSITVSNVGDVPLKNVTVTDTAPMGTRIVSAPGATITGNMATWQIPQLDNGSNKTFDLTLVSRQQGNLCNKATAQGPYGLAANAEACTKWIGVPAILLELVDTKDALLVGDPTTYIVRVLNQGSAQDSNVVITLEYPNGIEPLSASGATPGSIAGKTVTFAPYQIFKPKEQIEFRIQAKATGEGDNRVKVILNSDLLSTPVIEDESTTVY